MKPRPFKSLALAVTALPMAGASQAADMPVKATPSVTAAWLPQWQFSAEGGMLISKYSRTAFPNGVGPAFDKLGCDICEADPVDPTRSGSLVPPRNIGWYGALSIGRDIDPVWDWRLSGSFNAFNTNRRSTAINIDQGDIEEGFTSSRQVTESDRFKFATVDFDVGRKGRNGLLQTRAFAGLRALGTDESFNISDSEAKGLAECCFVTTQSNQLTQTKGRSNFVGVGPRIGLEGFYGTTVGVVGSVSAAFLGGWRYSTFEQIQTGTGSFTLCDGGCVTLPLSNSASANTVQNSKFVGVGNLAASLGLAWRPTPGTGVEVGYRVEYLSNVRESFAFANSTALTGYGPFEQKKDVLINAPYIKGSIRF